MAPSIFWGQQGQNGANQPQGQQGQNGAPQGMKPQGQHGQNGANQPQGQGFNPCPRATRPEWHNDEATGQQAQNGEPTRPRRAAGPEWRQPASRPAGVTGAQQLQLQQNPNGPQQNGMNQPQRQQTPQVAQQARFATPDRFSVEPAGANSAPGQSGPKPQHEPCSRRTEAGPERSGGPIPDGAIRPGFRVL